MKYRYLSIILLIFILSIGAVCAQDDDADASIVSAGSDDVISLNDNPIVLQDNVLSSEDEIHINDTNYNQYFDENGIINSNVSAGSDLYIGNITNKILSFNKNVNIFADDSSMLVESTIFFISGSDGSLVEGLTFNNNEVAAVCAIDVSDITIFDNLISIISNVNNTDSAIVANLANNLNISANVIEYNGKTDGYTPINAMSIVECDDAIIEDNLFEIEIPSAPIDWRENPPGSYDYVPYPASEGICISNSNGVSFKRNHISLDATDVIGDGDSIYAVEFKESDDAQIVENIIDCEGHEYIYGLVIRGDNFIISGNDITVDSDTRYANGIDIEGGSTGVVEENQISVLSPYVAYGIYSMYNYATMEAPVVDYINNNIYANSHAVYGMSLYGSETNIVGNRLVFHGNYTMGISSMMMDDVATITDNEIIVFGEKNDTANVGDMVPAQTLGILVMSESEIHNNAITTSGNYTIVSSSNDGEITDNYLLANELVGDESVLDKTDDATVENNVPNKDNNYNLTNDTFFLFFDYYGSLREGITGNLTFIGPFSDRPSWIYIDNPVVLLSDNATLYDMSFEIVSENVTVDGFNFICESIADVITVEADNVVISNNNFTVTGVEDDNNVVINVIDSDNVSIINNTIIFGVETNETYKNCAIRAENSNNLDISGNTITASLPSRSIDWTTGTVYSEGVCLDDCDNAVLTENTIGVKSNDKISTYDTIYAVHITGDNATLTDNVMGVVEAPYGYGLVITGKGFDISDNMIYAGENESYACGIDVESNSEGVIGKNLIVAVGESAYGIYTANWAGDVQANITNNIVVANGTNVFGMSLSGSEAVVDNNTIIAKGNFTTGIASAFDMIFITNNTIIANGTNEGTPTSYDSMGIETIGVHIVSGDALVKENNINATDKYAVSVEGTGAVTDNVIYADMLTGDFAVDYVQDNGIIVVNNTPEMELDYKLTNDTFYIYFDEEGKLREQITADNLTFIGEFSNLVNQIIIEDPIDLLSDNATLNNMGILIISDDVSVDGFNFVSDALNELISIVVSDNVSFTNNNFTVTGVEDDNNYVIFISESDNVLLDNNGIIFGVETNETYKNCAIYAEYSNNLDISGNTIAASLPSRSINWTTGTVYSEGVCLDDCDNAVLTENTIGVKSNDKISTYDTIYAVHITGDNATLTDNVMGVVEAPYGYGLVIAGEGFDISDNMIYAGENESYACGIDVESNSEGVIGKNLIVAVGESAYGIYTANWAGDVQANITNNVVVANGTNVFGMSLSGSEAVVDNNAIIANGNFTTGIASAFDMIFITNNTIIANGTNEGTPTSYDSMGIETIGVHIVSGDALVKDNNITSNSEYTVSVEGTGAVTDNYLIANEYTGDASVDAILGETLIANNTPAMQRAIVSAEDVVMYYKNGTRYTILLTDQNGKALSNKTVTITINGVSYNRTTDENGTASIAINLAHGNYTASVLYVGEGNYTNTTSENNITVLATVFGDDIVKVFRNGTQYYATFLDGQGNPLANGIDVLFNINGVMYTRQINGSEGKAKLNINLVQGEYVITAINLYTGDMNSNNITVLPLIESNDLVKYFRNDSQFVVTIRGADGNTVGAGENVTFNINGVFYTRQTNESGQAKLNINLAQGNYTITTIYNGCMVANNVEVKSILYAEDLIKTYGTSDQFIAYLVDGQGNPFPGQNVTFNVHGKLYNRTTDNDGRAALNIKLAAAVDTYIITSMYGGCCISNKIIVKPA